VNNDIEAVDDEDETESGDGEGEEDEGIDEGIPMEEKGKEKKVRAPKDEGKAFDAYTDSEISAFAHAFIDRLRKTVRLSTVDIYADKFCVAYIYSSPVNLSSTGISFSPYNRRGDDVCSGDISCPGPNI
jgi:hypothetical protein